MTDRELLFYVLGTLTQTYDLDDDAKERLCQLIGQHLGMMTEIICIPYDADEMVKGWKDETKT